jgi:AhpD family alkylhydroperoxidase
MSLHERDLELVALGSAIGGNCIPCLQWHYKKCLELGLSKQELSEAIAMAKKVKEVPNQKIYEAAEKLTNSTSTPAISAPPAPACGCGGKC